LVVKEQLKRGHHDIVLMAWRTDCPVAGGI
jgi:hypothetical protein